MTALESCGRYELIRRIALGGMAEIFLARETGLAGFERFVIIKRVLPNLSADTDFIDMFLDEARLAARLTHPNIVHIYELDEQEGTYFIAMEYVPGGDLHEILGRRKGVLVPQGDALHIISEVCGGLQFAHALAGPDGTPLGVVHRDVTPKNVLMSVDGVIKVMDFGIAKARAKLSVTRPGDIKGTFSYMAPEQARGEQVDRRADIYAVGALLYRLVTGKPAYPQTGNALLAAVRAGQFVRPRRVNPDVPPVIEEIILRAMAFDSRERFRTCGAMRREIAEASLSLGFRSDSESISALVHEAFPQVPGATAPIDAEATLPDPGPGADESTAIEAGAGHVPAPPSVPVSLHASPEEATGFLSMGDDEPSPFGLDAGTVEDEAFPSDPTDMVAVPGLNEAPTEIGGALDPQLAALTVGPDVIDPASVLPQLGESTGDREDPTHIMDSSVPAKGPPPPPVAPPVMPRIPAPPPPPEPVQVKPATPTMTQSVKRRPGKKKRRKGFALIVAGFFLGAMMITAAITLTLMAPRRNGAAHAQGTEAPTVDPGATQVDASLEPAEPEPPRQVIIPREEDLLPPTDADAGAADADGAPDGGDAAVALVSAPDPEPLDDRPIKTAPRPRNIEVPIPRQKVVGGKRPRDEGQTTKRGKGFLTVWTSPYSKVYVDGRYLGNTPLKREVRAGRHRLKLVNPESGATKNLSVQIRTGETKRVRQNL